MNEYEQRVYDFLAFLLSTRTSILQVIEERCEQRDWREYGEGRLKVLNEAISFLSAYLDDKNTKKDYETLHNNISTMKEKYCFLHRFLKNTENTCFNNGQKLTAKHLHKGFCNLLQNLQWHKIFVAQNSEAN